MRNYSYLCSLIPGLAVLAGNLMGGWWVASNAVFSLVLLAGAERFLPENRSNQMTESDWLPDGLLITHLFLQILCISSMVWMVSVHQLNSIQLLLLALSVGCNSGSSAIVIAHELIHRKNRIMRNMGCLLLFSAEIGRAHV